MAYERGVSLVQDSRYDHAVADFGASIRIKQASRRRIRATYGLGEPGMGAASRRCFEALLAESLDECSPLQLALKFDPYSSGRPRDQFALLWQSRQGLAEIRLRLAPPNKSPSGTAVNEQLSTESGLDDVFFAVSITSASLCQDLQCIAIAAMKTEPPVIESPLGNVYATGLAGQAVGGAAKPVTGKRKLSLSEDIDGETEEQSQKRARGRPRLDTKDETAADRRRTQIRLAQRAYRHRKDNAITSLEEKVKDLEKSNADMSREFHRFHNLVLAEGLLDASSEVANRFRAVTDNFLRINGPNLGETGYISPEDERATVLDGFRGPPEASCGSSAGIQSPPKSQPDTSGHTQLVPSPGHRTVADSIASYEVVAQATPDNASFPLYTDMGAVPNLVGYATLTSPFATLPLTSSLSYHELSFGRRLQRRTTERGLFLASMANPPPERYAAVFGFSLLFESRETIARRLSQQLANLIMPFQDQANPQKGPLEEKMEQRIRLTFGFEKEFLNADEIELYLRQLGINIPQQVEFVDAEVDVNTLTDTVPPVLTAHGSFSSQSSGYDNQNTHVSVSMPLNMTANHALLQQIPIQPNSSAQAAGFLPYMCAPGMENAWNATSWQKPKLTISVGVLVEELASKSVCMGKHPGVRVKDVNNAIKVAAGLA